MSDEFPTFRTKTGFCRITSEAIEIHRQGARGSAAQALGGSRTIWRILAVYLVMGLASLAWGIYSVSVLRHYFGGAIALVCGAVALLVVLKSRRCSAAPRIPKNTVHSVVATAPVPPWKRGYFTVHFREGSKNAMRLIVLPGSREDGEHEFEKATEIFRESGFDLAT